MAPILMIDGKLAFDLHPVATDEQVERVVELVEADLGGKVLLSEELPGYRKAVVQLDGATLVFRHSSQEGAWVESVEPGAEAALQRVRAFLSNLLEA